MHIGKTIITAALAATAFSAPALAQDAAFKLPEQCTMTPAAGGMDHWCRANRPGAWARA